MIEKPVIRFSILDFGFLISGTANRKSKIKNLKCFVFCVLCLVVAGGDVLAGTTGKIAGVVTDVETGKALVGAEIALSYATEEEIAAEEEFLFAEEELAVTAAVSSKTGYYVITNVAPGTYDVMARISGYGPVTMSGVKVLADLTSTVNFPLNPTVVELAPIVVIAIRPMVLLDVTESRQIIEAEEMENMPVTTFQDVVATQAGAVVESLRHHYDELYRSPHPIHIRGGRGQEVGYRVDDISIDDPFLGGAVADLNVHSIQEMEMITGGMNAEYGNAQSGIINVVMKEGGIKHSGKFTYKNGIFVPKHFGRPIYGPSFDRDTGFYEQNELFKGVWMGDPDPDKDGYASTVEVSNGTDPEDKDDYPEDLSPSSFSEVYPEVWTDDPEIAERKTLETAVNKIPIDLKDYQNLYSLEKDYGLTPAQGYELSIGGPLGGKFKYFLAGDYYDTFRGDFLPHAKDRIYALQNKFTFHPTSKIKLTLGGFLEHEETQDYVHTWKYLLDKYEQGKGDNSQVNLAWTHNISPSTFYSLKLGRFETKFKSNPPGLWWIHKDDPTAYPQGMTEDEYNSFLGQDNQPNTGDEIQNEMEKAWSTKDYTVAGDRPRFDDRSAVVYTAKVDVTSQVHQNHQLKAGTEVKLNNLDRYSVMAWGGGNIYSEIYNVQPKAASAYAQDKMEFQGMIANVGLRYDYLDPAASYPSDKLNPTEVDEKGRIIRLNLKEAAPKHAFSPRLGISHPISDRDVLHFTYAHLYQPPVYHIMYENLSYSSGGYWKEMGDPNLEFERTVSYEVGVEHQFTDTLMMDVTGFYKDITNLVDTEFIELGEKTYNLAVNADYGNVRGAEVIVKKRPGKYVSGKLSYTYAIAKGRSSGIGLGSWVSYWQQIMPMQDYYLDWDQRHTVSLNVDFRMPKGSGWRLGSIKPLSDFGVNMLAYYGSGLPYTPEAKSFQVPNFNSKRYLPTSDVNLKVSKGFHIFGLDYTFFAEVYNVFNKKNMLAAKDLSFYERYQDPGGRSDDPFIWGPPRWMYAGVSVGF